VSSRRPSCPPPAALALLAALLPVPTLVAAAPGQPPQSSSRSVRAAALAAELRAAQSHRLYLVIDPVASRLELKADGLLLHRFPIESALFGRSRLAGGAFAWPAASFTLVSELEESERPRIPIQSPEGPAPAGAAAPTSTRVSAAREAAVAGAPTHYRLRFVPTLDVSVLGEAGASNLPGRVWRTRHRLLEGWEAVFLRLRGKPVPPRVVLVMAPREAQRLFLTLLPETRLLVRAPAP
jgi:hypothetical protein